VVDGGCWNAAEPLAEQIVQINSEQRTIKSVNREAGLMFVITIKRRLRK
jgi:hypothetical protein